jgi:uncharacterized protein (TIGR03435 family)
LLKITLYAYRLKPYQLVAPSWIDSARYEVAAKIQAGADWAQISAMLASLLVERFHIVSHRETKQMPVYALLITKDGAKLKEAGGETGDPDARIPPPKLTKDADGFPDLAPGVKLPHSYEVVIAGSDGIVYKLWARHETVAQLADRLTSQLARPVIDMTGLPAEYDFALSWTMEAAGGIIPRTYPPPDMIENRSSTPVMSEPGPSIFGALETQIGLRLEQRRAPVEVLVVQQADRIPSDN